MRCFIDAAVLCDKGKLRSKNQDNFWFAETYLEHENTGLPEPLKERFKNADFPVFAVFDGMGGEKYGEIAAWLAAKTFNEHYTGDSKRETQSFLLEACSKMNSSIVDYADAKRTGNMGTTAAIVAFNKRDIYICNIGDSRIFQYSCGELTQISRDHTSSADGGRKPSLTQNLGIPEDEFIIEPYIAKGDYQSGDRYLICSDGLTDMVQPEVIKKVMSEYGEAQKCAERLMELALDGGGVDNTTIIVCDVHKKGLI
jgi:protein phosphatase